MFEDHCAHRPDSRASPASTRFSRIDRDRHFAAYHRCGGLDMTALGLALLLAGAMLLVAEAHAPGGFLAVAAGTALIAGATLVIASLGGGAALALPVGVGLGAVAGGWGIVATRKAAGVRRTRIQAGAESLCGRVGVVRRWSDSVGQVFLDGALWRARQAWGDLDGETLREGDSVVVEHVNGLTLAVRRADEWELMA
jgi:membrane-bound serine protease (ClpP class)